MHPLPPLRGLPLPRQRLLLLEEAQDRAAMHKLALLMAESLNLDSWIAECGLSKP